jgi:hypothetical protein
MARDAIGCGWPVVNRLCGRVRGVVFVEPSPDRPAGLIVDSFDSRVNLCELLHRRTSPPVLYFDASSV